MAKGKRIASGVVPTGARPDNKSHAELTENDLIEFLISAVDAGGLQPGEMWRDELYKQLNAQKPMTPGQFKYLLDRQKKAGTIVARPVGHHMAYRMASK